MNDQTHRDEEPVAYLEHLDNTPSPQRPRCQQPQAEYSGQGQPQLHMNCLQEFFAYHQGMEQQHWERQLQIQETQWEKMEQMRLGDLDHREAKRQEKARKAEQRHIEDLERLDTKREEDREKAQKQQRQLSAEARKKEDQRRIVDKLPKYDSNDTLDSYSKTRWYRLR